MKQSVPALFLALFSFSVSGAECRLDFPLELKTKDPRVTRLAANLSSTYVTTLGDAQFHVHSRHEDLQRNSEIKIELYELEKEGRASGLLGVRVYQEEFLGAAFSHAYFGSGLEGSYRIENGKTVFDTKESRGFPRMRAVLEGTKLASLEIEWIVAPGGVTETVCLRNARVKHFQGDHNPEFD